MLYVKLLPDWVWCLNFSEFAPDSINMWYFILQHYVYDHLICRCIDSCDYVDLH